MPRWVPILLLGLLPLIVIAGRRLAQLATRDRQLAAALTPACVLAVWLLPIHALGLMSKSFWMGLFGGMILSGIAGAVVLLKLPPPPVDEGPRMGRWALLGTVLAMAALFGTEARFFIWDEGLVTGHLSIPLQMLNGIYPPRHLSFAQFELRYHYGFDLLNAVVAALLGQPHAMWKVVHGVSLALFGATFYVLWGIGERWIGRRGGPYAACIVSLSGGFPYTCHVQPGEIPPFMNACSMLPPYPSNFLQHPWSLGLPVGFAAMLLYSARRTKCGWWWLGLSLLMLLLSFSQIVFFGSILLAIGCSALLTTEGPWWRRCLTFGVWAVAIIGVGFLLHGFFARTAEPPPLTLDYRPFWREGNLRDFENFVGVSLGVATILGPLGFFYLKHERVFLGALTLFGLVVYHMLTYPNSWDIAKFLMVAQIGLGLSMAAVFANWLHRDYRLRWLAELALVAAVGISAEFYIVGEIGNPKAGDLFPLDIATFANPADQDVVDFLRAHIRAGETVLRTDSPWAYSILGGLPATHMDWGSTSFGFSHAVWDAHSYLYRDRSTEPAQYLNLGIDWFVLGPHDKELRASVAQWVKDGHATLVFSKDPLDVYRLN